MLTQGLAGRGLIRGERHDREWKFFASEKQHALLVQPRVAARAVPPLGDALTSATFETLARRILGEHYGMALPAASIPGVRKRFDFVSHAGRVVGDAKYYTLVGGIGLPPAKFSIIAEHVWLLEKTHAPSTFLVFGNDRRVPMLWLERYGNLVSGVVFYFLTDDGQLGTLTRGDEPARRA